MLEIIFLNINILNHQSFKMKYKKLNMKFVKIYLKKNFISNFFYNFFYFDKIYIIFLISICRAGSNELPHPFSQLQHFRYQSWKNWEKKNEEITIFNFLEFRRKTNFCQFTLFIIFFSFLNFLSFLILISLKILGYSSPSAGLQSKVFF